MGAFWNGWIHAEASDHDAIKVKRVYIDLNDGYLSDGVLFSQIMYWHSPNRETGKPRLRIQREGHLWLAKTYDDWWDECRINASTARKCIERIIKRGLLIKHVWMFDGKPTVHLRVDVDQFEHQMNYVLHEASLNRPKIAEPIDTNGQLVSLQTGDSLTETTPQTTAVEAIAPAKDSSPLPPHIANGFGMPKRDAKNNAVVKAVEAHPIWQAYTRGWDDAPPALSSAIAAIEYNNLEAAELRMKQLGATLEDIEAFTREKVSDPKRKGDVRLSYIAADLHQYMARKRAQQQQAAQPLFPNLKFIEATDEELREAGY